MLVALAQSGRGGIGRRARLGIWWSASCLGITLHASSTLVARTKLELCYYTPYVKELTGFR